MRAVAFIVTLVAWSPVARAEDDADDEEAIVEPEPSGPVRMSSERRDLPLESISTEELPVGQLKAAVIIDATELRAGPGAAYVSRGRAYKGDVLDVRRRAETGDWIEVESAGLRGWVRATHVQFGEAPRGRVAPTDVGRSRRQSNYGYDEKGRRLRPDGQTMGSGEGTGRAQRLRDRDRPSELDETPREPSEDVEPAEEVPDASEDESPPSTRKAEKLRLVVGLGFGQARRIFDSNVAVASPLTHGEFQANGLLLDLSAAYSPLRYLGVEARALGHFTGSTQVPQNDALGLRAPVDLNVGGLALGADALGILPLGRAAKYSVEGRVGLRWWEQSAQPTKPYPIFLTNTLTAVAVGLGGRAKLPAGLDASLHAAYLVPLAESHDPVKGSELDTGSGYEVVLDLGWNFAPGLAATLGARVLQSQVDRKGASEHADARFDPPLGYTQARETNSIQGATVGVRWTP
jgi:hypothetical protein